MIAGGLLDAIVLRCVDSHGVPLSVFFSDRGKRPSHHRYSSDAQRDDEPSLRATTVHHAGGVIDQGGSLAPYPVIDTPITPYGVIDQGASLASHPVIDAPIARDGRGGM